MVLAASLNGIARFCASNYPVISARAADIRPIEAKGRSHRFPEEVLFMGDWFQERVDSEERTLVGSVASAVKDEKGMSSVVNRTWSTSRVLYR
jgi:hypothetical protein